MMKINQKAIRLQILEDTTDMRELLEDPAPMDCAVLLCVLWEIEDAQNIEEVFREKIPCQFIDNPVKGKAYY